MPVIVKICGLRTDETLDTALDAGADMVGFVFFPPSPRHLALDDARRLGMRVRGRAMKVALTVDADDATLAAIVDALDPDLLQLHGRETPERVASVKATFGRPVMKVVAVETKDDLRAVDLYTSLADRLLFDAHPPRGATRPGGLGAAFDWRLLEGVDPVRPFMLSGGLTSANVAEALRITRAPGVDVSSGVERVPGEKDPDKIRAFIHAAREAGSSSWPGSTRPSTSSSGANKQGVDARHEAGHGEVGDTGTR
jgi:phosphoribosylanthranilate isomerase